MSVLVVEGLEVHRDERVVLRNLTFRAARGERVALMGASGAGKTTILRVIAGLEQPAAGRVIPAFDRAGLAFVADHVDRVRSPLAHASRHRGAREYGPEPAHRAHVRLTPHAAAARATSSRAITRLPRPLISGT